MLSRYFTRLPPPRDGNITWENLLDYYHVSYASVSGKPPGPVVVCRGCQRVYAQASTRELPPLCARCFPPG